MNTMMINPWWMIFRNADDQGGGGAGAGDGGTPPAAGDGGDPPAGGDGGDPPAGGDGGTPPAAGDGGDPPAGDGGGDPPAGGGGDDNPWFEALDWKDGDLKTMLIQSGYHKGSMEDALQRALMGEKAATQKLGRKPEEFLDRPREGQERADWMRANADLFGLPETAEGYEISIPDTLPKGVTVSDAALTAYRNKMHELGAPPEIVQASVDQYVEMLNGTFKGIQNTVAVNETKLDADLRAEWGAQFEARQQRARNTFQALTDAQKMSDGDKQVLAGKLNDVMGDASMVRFFEGMTDLLAEDKIVTPRNMGGAMSTLHDLKARKAELIDGGEIHAAHGTPKQKTLMKELDSINEAIVRMGGG